MIFLLQISRKPHIMGNKYKTLPQQGGGKIICLLSNMNPEAITPI